MTMASENVFLSAIQPNSSVTTYGLPSEIQLGDGGSVADEVARARRVQQQVQMRLAEKSTLPRQNGSATQYAMSGKHQQVSLRTFTRLHQFYALLWDSIQYLCESSGSGKTNTGGIVMVSLYKLATCLS